MEISELQIKLYNYIIQHDNSLKHRHMDCQKYQNRRSLNFKRIKFNNTNRWQKKWTLENKLNQMKNISFNKPYLTGKETHYLFKAVYDHKHIPGNGYFTKKTQPFLKKSNKLVKFAI